MELEHTFSVPVPVDEAWRVLLDIERIAPCMPGATIESVDGRDFTGKVKVKVGPITVTYTGKASFVTVDEVEHHAVIEARAKETRGSGTAKATITARLADEGTSTRVDVRTDLAITGKPAQFGRGVMADVGGKLIGQFADCLAGELAGPTTGAATDTGPAADGGTAPAGAVGAVGDSEPSSAPPAAPAGATEATTPAAAAGQPTAAAQPRPRPTADTIDLLGAAGAPVAKRLAPALAALLALAAIVFTVRRRRH